MAKYEKEQKITHTHKVVMGDKEFDELMKGFGVWVKIDGHNILLKIIG